VSDLVAQQQSIDPQAHRQPLQLPLFTFLTLCCSCSRLKAGSGRWTRRIVEEQLYPKTPFSHGICPSCFKQLYPRAYRKRNRE